MSYSSYSAVSNPNQGTFNNPRQKMWFTMQLGMMGWSIALSTNDLEQAKDKAAELLRAGGMYMSIDRVIVVEVVPIDFTMTPTV